MLDSIGIQEFIAGSEDEFVKLGKSWASRRNELLSLRIGLREKMTTASLVDADSYTRDFESQLERIVHRAEI